MAERDLFVPGKFTDLQDKIQLHLLNELLEDIVDSLHTAANPASIVARTVSSTTVTSTATETTVFSATLPAGTLGTDRLVRLDLGGDYQNDTGISRTCTVRVKLGSTTLAALDPVLTTATDRGAVILTTFISGTGSTTSQVARSMLLLSGIGGNTGADTSATPRFAMHNSVAEDAASDLTLAVTVEHSAASASLTFNATFVQVEAS